MDKYLLLIVVIIVISHTSASPWDHYDPQEGDDFKYYGMVSAPVYHAPYHGPHHRPHHGPHNRPYYNDYNRQHNTYQDYFMNNIQRRGANDNYPYPRQNEYDYDFYNYPRPPRPVGGGRFWNFPNQHFPPPWQQNEPQPPPSPPPFPSTPPPLPSTSTTSSQAQAIMACMRNCPVTPEYNPVCGTNNVTYNNPGRLNCAKFCGVVVEIKRTSSCSVPVPATAAPVDTSNGPFNPTPNPVSTMWTNVAFPTQKPEATTEIDFEIDIRHPDE